MLDSKYIDQLLEKFWEAETTEAEEKSLQDYFQSSNVAAEHQYALAFFKAQSNESLNVNNDYMTSIVTKLIDKYFDAETSLEEEAILKEYFIQENIEASLSKYKSMFVAFAKESMVSYDKELILQKEAKIIELPSIKSTTQKETAKVVSFKWAKVAVAAAFIGLGVYFFGFRNSGSFDDSKPQLAAKHIEPETPEEALEMTMQALAMVSKKYKKGEQELLQGMHTMNENSLLK